MTDEPTLFVLPRGRGRPRSQTETAPCATRLPIEALDTLITLARLERVSVSALVREGILVVLESRNIRTE